MKGFRPNKYTFQPVIDIVKNARYLIQFQFKEYMQIYTPNEARNYSACPKVSENLHSTALNAFRIAN